ncbi:MAG: DUF4058 family protein [Fimbriimonadales bacterium]|nr:DUF4058 family protein [Fimbriimonadales bacterium]
MPNPFPGMNPYLEAYWRDMHATLLVLAREALNERLPDDLIARIEERVYVELPAAPPRGVYPDVRIIHGGRPPAETGGAPVAVAPRPAARPILVEVRSEPITETYINIIATAGERVITSIEILSLANKLPGSGQAQYFKKQQETLQAGVNLVEIDLLRGGEWILSLPEVYLSEDARGVYHVCVFRATQPELREIYPIALEEPLPAISVPLRAGEADAVLELQPLVDRAYEQGRYHRLIDYAQDLPPPLTDAQRDWIAQLLREKEVRQFESNFAPESALPP